MRELRPFLLKAVAFPLVLGVVLLALKTQDAHADIGPYWRKLQDVRRLQPQTLLLGSSRTFRHVDPVRLDRLRGDGATTYNFGIPGSRGLEVHYRADRILGMDLPGLERLVIELVPFDAEVNEASRSTRRVQHYHDWRRATLGAEAALASPLPLRSRVAAAADRYRLFARNMLLVGWGRAWIRSVQAERRPPRREPDAQRGFAPLQLDATENLGTRRADFLSDEGQAEFLRRLAAIRQRDAAVPTEQDRVAAEAWARLAERAASQGVDVVFVEQVGTVGGAGLSRLLAERLGPERVIVLNDPAAHPEFYEAEAWFDVAHLTAPMAERLTGLLARALPPRPTGAR